MKKVLLLAGIVVSVPWVVCAQANNDGDEKLKALEERIRVLETEVQALKNSQPAPGVQTAVFKTTVPASPRRLSG